MDRPIRDPGTQVPDRTRESSTIIDYLVDYYRCPRRYVRLAVKGTLSQDSGYFRFGRDVVCYGQLSGQRPSIRATGHLPDAMHQIVADNGVTYLTFHPGRVADNLRYELYAKSRFHRNSVGDSIARWMYYTVRPLIPSTVRRAIQKVWFANRTTLRFPRWPVDCSVDILFEQLLLLSLRSGRVHRIPFIWFWPDGAPACAVITHDVETAKGRDFSRTVMDADEAHGIRSSFTVVPEGRYEVTTGYLDSISKRGFEVTIHDLNHDGHLFRNKTEFLKRAKKINAYASQFGTNGFRAAVLYRKQLWLEALSCSYDMSVPNVAHLEPQGGGCCTVMPYFIGDILELPVTTTQDYALFNYLKLYSLDLWKQQMALIMQQNGLISFIVHPDYVTESREWNLYRLLLEHLARLRAERRLWITTPGEIDRWWRQRDKMTLVENGHGVRIDGEGSERARVAYASEVDGRIVFTLEAGTP